MFGKIVYISDNVAHVSIPEDAPVIMNLMNMHVVFVIVQNFAKLNPVILNIECVLIQFLEL